MGVHPIYTHEKELPIEVYDEFHVHSQLPAFWFLAVLNTNFLILNILLTRNNEEIFSMISCDLNNLRKDVTTRKVNSV